MKNILLPAAMVFLLTACTMRNPDYRVKQEESLLQTDKAFCDMEQKDGMAKAMNAFYDDNVMGIQPGQPVMNGKVNVLKAVADAKMDSMNTLVWKADRAFVSSSGDMGYVWGHYTMKTNAMGTDTTLYGAYVTIYKKQADGSWKAVVDQTNNTPKPM
jgi:ketosteroid isomerase-like protein